MFLLCCIGAEKNIANWSVFPAFVGNGLLLLSFLRPVIACSHSKAYIISLAKHWEPSWLISNILTPVHWWHACLMISAIGGHYWLFDLRPSPQSSRCQALFELPAHVLCLENRQALALWKPRRRAFKGNPFPLPAEQHLRTNHISIKQKEKTLSITCNITSVL